MKSKKDKSCFDCLHCKVSATSSEKCRLFFCATKTKRQNHKEQYWLIKRVCKNFDDMSA